MTDENLAREFKILDVQKRILDAMSDDPVNAPWLMAELERLHREDKLKNERT